MRNRHPCEGFVAYSPSLVTLKGHLIHVFSGKTFFGGFWDFPGGPKGAVRNPANRPERFTQNFNNKMLFKGGMRNRNPCQGFVSGSTKSSPL